MREQGNGKTFLVQCRALCAKDKDNNGWPEVQRRKPEAEVQAVCKKSAKIRLNN